ncbi:hypothetical protein Mapa_008826 [Marchantia paleacea]|nr:hypothetical protein Mapa_008826 [Marchantia paleacea]
MCCIRDRCHSNFGIYSIILMALEHRFLQLLELPTSAATSKIFLTQKIQDKLFPGGHIHGVVRPDLPEVHPFFKFVSARVATDCRCSDEKSEGHMPPIIDFCADSKCFWIWRCTSVGVWRASFEEATCC